MPNSDVPGGALADVDEGLGVQAGAMQMEIRKTRRTGIVGDAFGQLGRYRVFYTVA